MVRKILVGILALILAILPAIVSCGGNGGTSPGRLLGYNYYKEIPIAGATGAGTNYQVLLKVGETSGTTGEDFDVGGHCTDFPNDIRFTDDDGSTELKYWLEGVSGTAPNRLAKFWVKVADNLDSNQTIYIYYGKSGTSSASNGEDTFDFFEGFDSGIIDAGNPIIPRPDAHWQVSTPETWYENGKYYQFFDYGDDITGSVIQQKGLAWTSDLQNSAWTLSPNNPVMVASGSGWDANKLYGGGDILKVGGVYYNYYCGEQSYLSIGLATTTDSPENWTNNSWSGRTRKLSVTQIWENPQVRACWILKDADGLTPLRYNGKYWMCYTGGFSGNYKIGLAYSSDSWGLNMTWTKLPEPTLLGGTWNGTDVSTSGNYVSYTKFTASASGNVTHIRVKSSAGGYVKIAVYTDNAGDPGSLLIANNNQQYVTGLNNGSNLLSLGGSVALTQGTDYWIGTVSSASGCIRRTTTDTGNRRYKAATFSSFTFPETAAWTNNDTYADKVEARAWSVGMNPILESSGGSDWDSKNCYSGDWWTENGTYYLFYDSRAAIGYATASTPDGQWTKYSGNPVLTHSVTGETLGDVWDGVAIYYAQISKSNNTYYLFYSGLEPHNGYYENGYATSNSITGTWTKYTGTKWKQDMATAPLQVTSGILSLKNNNNAHYESIIAVSFNITSYRFMARINNTPEDGVQTGMLIPGFGSGTNRQGWLLAYYATPPATQLKRYLDDAWTSYSTDAYPTPPFTVELTQYGGIAKAYYDNTLEETTSINATAVSPTICSFSQPKEIDIDWIAVGKFVDPEPVVGTAGSEEQT